MFSDVKKRDLNGKTKDPAENKCIMWKELIASTDITENKTSTLRIRTIHFGIVALICLKPYNQTNGEEE
jgi:hypothetical protein